MTEIRHTCTPGTECFCVYDPDCNPAAKWDTDRIPFDVIDEDMLRRGAEAAARYAGDDFTNPEDYMLARVVLEAALGAEAPAWWERNHGGSE